jgi:hypothetical protein
VLLDKIGSICGPSRVRELDDAGHAPVFVNLRVNLPVLVGPDQSHRTLVTASYQHRRLSLARAHIQAQNREWGTSNVQGLHSHPHRRIISTSPHHTGACARAQIHLEWGRYLHRRLSLAQSQLPPGTTESPGVGASHAQNGLSPHHATAPSLSHHVNIAASHLCSHKYRHSTNGSGGRAKTMSMTMFTTHTTRERWPPSDSSHLSGSCSNPTPVILHMPRHTSRSEHPLGTSTI